MKNTKTTTTYYGLARGGKPTLFGADYYAVVLTEQPGKRAKWGTIGRGHTNIASLSTSDSAVYRRFVREGSWVPFPGFPFAEKSPE